MEARIRVEEAGSRLGALRRKGASPDEIVTAERELSNAQFQLAIENALKRHRPGQEIIELVCARLKATVAA